MKILLVHEYYRSSAPSGENAVFLNEREMLDRNGIDTASLEIHNDDLDDSTLVKKLILGKQTIWSGYGYSLLTEAVRKHRPDIVHFHNTFPLLSPSSYKACHDMGTAVVQTLHNYRLICPGALLQRDEKPCENCVGRSVPWPALVHKCYRHSLVATLPLAAMTAWNLNTGAYRNHVDAYIALTEFSAGVMSRGGLPVRKIYTKPNVLLDPPPAGKGEGGYAVYVGRLSSEKGILTLLKAWKSLPDIPLKVLGDGPLGEKAKNIVNLAGLNVEFLGSVRRHEVLDIVSNAVFQIIPSEWYEGFPMVVLEAYASGTPIIASRIGSLDEIVISGKTGEKFKAGDSSSIVDIVSKFWSEKNSISDYRKNARAQFDGKYSEKDNIEALLGIYRTVLTEQQS